MIDKTRPSAYEQGKQGSRFLKTDSSFEYAKESHLMSDTPVNIYTPINRVNDKENNFGSRSSTN